ncbi:dTDP-4-dehydrorhamnose 3,5-epimerase family protein [Nocardia sp. NPDC056000]|uniref:dTDP-4-dehydrorhamnose 3,5-epimerase family protein n=1 Tax=Nocardia sp. NPDC056000 TaxID=3345674 RepID=UPI0035D7F22F
MTLYARELSVSGAWEFTPSAFADDRGLFLEAYRSSDLEKAVGHPFDLAQINCSVSNAGVLRGIHYTENPPGQAKYATCVRGAMLDVVVDLRPDSPTYRQWDSVLLDDVDRRAVYLGAGMGHAILSLEDNSTVVYLCSREYDPRLEREIDALDPGLAIEWPTVGRDGRPLTLVRSPKDAAAAGIESLP